MAGKVTRSIEDRLWEKADVSSSEECWNWRGARDGRGRYGLFFRNGRLVGAHVAAFELVHGPVDVDLEIDHQCNNTACVNPAHLRAMTHAENIRRGVSRAAINHRKQVCGRGHPFTVENTRVDNRGSRICRTCDNAKDRARHAVKKGRAQ